MAISRRSMMLGTAAGGAAALTLAACGDSSGGSDGGSGGSGEMVLANNTEPQAPLLTTNTNEVGGGRVLTSLYAGLVYYTAKGEVENDLAESIESDDKQTWTITLKSGLKFSDGSDLTAQNFVDAWNFGALSTNAQKSQSFFEPIEGFDEVAGENPSAETMKGLEVTDDTTFKVTLKSAQSDFPNRLGYTAYMPLPSSAFDDPEAFGKEPISNGPYKFESWTPNSEIVIVPNENYDGARKAKNAGITFVVYDKDETAYNDLQSDAVDVLDQLPASALATFEDDLAERAVNAPGALFQSITIPQEDPNFSGEAGKIRRKAISRAIDRKSICDSIFNGTRTPATDFVAPTVEGGGQTDIPGAEVLEFDAAEAKKLWEEAEAITPFEGAFTISSNSDGPHNEWIEAAVNSVKNTLGIEAEFKTFPAFGEFRQQIDDRTMTGAFRSGWQADYPSVYNFLGPLYSSAAADGNGSNDGDYKNEEFDGLLDEALASPDAASALEKYTAAEAVLMEDLPVIPLWYQNALGGYSTLVQGVTFGWDTVPLYYEITK